MSSTWLVDGTPEIMRLATDAHKHLIHKPFVARPWPAPFQRVGEQPTETQAPVADAFVADYNATGSQDCLDVAQAQAETVIQPDRMLDHLGRKAKATVRVGRGRHPIRMPSRTGAANLTT